MHVALFNTGAGLAYIIYPAAVTRLPISPLWAVLFMLMIINLGLGTQITLVTTSHTTLLDVFDASLRRGRRPLMLLAALCVLGYLLGLVMTTRVRHSLARCVVQRQRSTTWPV